MLKKLDSLEKYEILTEEDMLDSTGGLVILGIKVTAKVIVKAAGNVGTGIGIGAAAGRIFR